jgi:hypothetical protein
MEDGNKMPKNPFSSNNSWKNQTRDSGGFFGTSKRCPPIGGSCDVKNFVGSKEKKKRKDKEKEKGWPFKGSYNPAREKGKGK